VRIGLMGFGTVGSGVAHILHHYREDIAKQTGGDVHIARVLVRTLERPRGTLLDDAVWTTNADDIVAHPDIDLVIEVMGGLEETRALIERALRAGKPVVTANKDVVARYGAQLCAIALEHGCDLFYEASVAGGIPIIRALAHSYASDRITRLCGIVNGTTNYMLTRMAADGASYEAVLKEAQALGYAEADPSADVCGWDAARKMAILSTLAFHAEVQLDDVATEGIDRVTQADIAYGAKLGYTVKLLGTAARVGQRVTVSVQPTMVHHAHPLASVHGVFNAVYVYSEAIGAAMYVGAGAGSLPTAASVVADVIAAVRHNRLGVSGKTWSRELPLRTLLPEEEVRGKYFYLLSVADRVGVLAQITDLFARIGVSLQSVLQQSPQLDGPVDVILITHETHRAAHAQCLEALERLDAVEHVKSVYQVLDA
jgi:homoserine dehydrogenase